MASTSQEHTAWTAAGSDTAAKNTYASIRSALASVEQEYGVEIFLHGSYANTTNIRADSDVDIVVMTRRAFLGAIERLSSVARAQYDRLPRATFTAADLRQAVLTALIAYYGAARVHQGNKCIRVDKTPGYVDADVVTCLEYRWYRGSTTYSDYVEGIVLQPARRGQIINFPKEHISNGQIKNSICSGHYKESVRQVKRLRNRAVDEGRLRREVAPGYLLECMVYNVPPSNFVGNDSQRLANVVLWLRHADKTSFLSCDGIHYLFRTDPGNFNTATAQTILDALWDAY